MSYIDTYVHIATYMWAKKVLKATTHTLTYVGGYTQSTSSSLSPEGIAVNPVSYHCTGQENSLQTCNSVTTSRCSRYDVTTIVCVQGNTSGMRSKVTSI